MKRCAGHTARNLVRHLSLGTRIAFPKLALTGNSYATTVASAGFAAISFPTRSDN